MDYLIGQQSLFRVEVKTWDVAFSALANQKPGLEPIVYTFFLVFSQMLFAIVTVVGIVFIIGVRLCVFYHQGEAVT